MEAVKMSSSLEARMEEGGVLMVKTANGLTIRDNADYERGNDILKDIKGRIKQVKDYWKEPKAAAQKAHKELVAREAQMLKPLEEAEGVIKKAMLAYTQEIRRRQQEAEAEARRQQEEERRRLAAIAEEAEKNGDAGSAEFMREMAEAVDMPEVVTKAAPAAKGVSVRTTWKARVTDPKMVPAYFEGLEIRTINMATLNFLARESGGQVKIPGVEMYEESTMSVRA